MFVVVPVMLMFTDWLAGLSVRIAGSRFSISRPTGKPITVRTKKYPILSQINPTHQPMKMKYKARTNKPC